MKSPYRPTLFFFLVMIQEHNYLFVLALEKKNVPLFSFPVFRI